MRIGHLSDLHCQDSRSVNRTKEAVTLLLQQEPEIVLLTGDYVSTGHSARWLAECTQALAPLNAVSRGVFAVLGNHDFYCGYPKTVTRMLEDSGIHVLRNSSYRISGPSISENSDVWLVGLDSRSAGQDDLKKALEGVPISSLKILLIHEPDYADEAPPGFVLQLSGHSHGGQFRIPGLPPLYVPAFGRHYPIGLQRGPHHWIYTTRGVGMMRIQIRLWCPSEVTLLTLSAT